MTNTSKHTREVVMNAGEIEFKGSVTIYEGKVGQYEGQLYLDDKPIEHSYIMFAFMVDYGLNDEVVLREAITERISELYIDKLVNQD